MTNKPMLSVERELLERLTENWNGTDARIELRALLDKEVDGNSHAPKQQGEPVAVVIEETHNYGRYLVFGAGGSEVQQPRPVVERKAHLFDQTLPIGTKLYAEQPAPVAVVLPERLNPAELDELEVIEVLLSSQGLSNLAGTMAAARQFIDEVNRLNGVKP